MHKDAIYSIKKIIRFVYSILFFFYNYKYKYIWSPSLRQIWIPTYLGWLKRENTNINIFGLTKKGQYKYKYEYYIWHLQKKYDPKYEYSDLDL